MSLFNRLLISFLIAILVPSLFVGIYSFRQVSQAIEEEVRHSVNQSVEMVNQNISSHISQAVELSTVVYINPTVQRIMSRQSPTSWTQLQDDLRELREHLANVTRYQEMYTVRLFYQDRGQFPKEFAIPELQSDVLLTGSAYTSLSSPSGMGWTTEPLLPHLLKGEPYITLVRELRGMEDSRHLGVITVSMSEKRLWQIIENVKFGQSGFVFIMDEQGRVVSHHNKSLLGEDLSLKPYASQVLEDQSGDFFAKVNGEEYLFVYEQIEGTPWKLVGFSNTRELTSRVDAIRNATIFAALSCFGLAILYSIYTSGWFSKRIKDLIKAMRKIERGNWGTQLTLSGSKPDEISQLYSHFNRMSLELSQHVESVKEANRKMREAELRALQHQINPHFLYNTLDSINWMAATRYQATDISLMVTSLANLFRLSLNKSNEITTVHDEIEHVKCYVIIQKIRFDNEFELRVEADPEIENAGMIKLILQPLVENSIIHGFHGIDYPGNINIRISRQGELLILEVADNGVGCDREQMNLLLRNPGSADSKGYGLRNVNERIKLLYGPSYGLQFIEPESGLPGTRIQILLMLKSTGTGEVRG